MNGMRPPLSAHQRQPLCRQKRRNAAIPGGAGMAA